MTRARCANPAHALDGGIPSLLHIDRHWPAASDEHRSAETILRRRCSKGMITNLNRAFALRAGAFVLVQMLAAAGVFAQGAATPASAPVSILRVAPDDPANWGFRPLRPGRGFPVPIGTTFVVTNHTSATTALNLMAIEVKAGSNWITQLTPHGPFMLSASNAVPTPGSTNGFIPGLTTTELLPHASAYATISFSGASGRTGPAPGEPVGVGMNYLAGHPTGAVWRVVFSVQ